MSQQRYEGASLQSVLAEVRERWGEDVSIVEANKVRRGGLGGFFAKERYEVIVEADEDKPAPAPAAAPASTPGVPFADRLLSLADGVDDTVPTVSTEQADFATVLAAIRRQAEGEPEAPAPAESAAVDRLEIPRPEPVVAHPAPAVTRNERPAPVISPAARHHGVSSGALVRLGLPKEIVQRVPVGTDAGAALFRMAAQLPQPPPLPECRGAVVAVVGDRADALALARSLSLEIGVDEDQVVVAAPEEAGRGTSWVGSHKVPLYRQITGAELAAEQRRSWRRRARPTVVAVDCRPGRADGWARRILDALEPTMVWGAVDASRKPEDVSAWAEHVGGIDALAVSRLDETVSPAAVLRCGIPVGRIDGAAATPAEWTARLAPRLAS